MAQMPIQHASGRAEPYAPPPPATRPPATRPPAIAAKFPTAPVPAAQAVDPGAIPGRALRPGALDQMTFRQRLEAANRGGPVPPRPTGQSPLMLPPAAKAAPSIPTLTPAQLAALGVDLESLDLSGLDSTAAATGPDGAAPELTTPEPAAPESMALDAVADPAAESEAVPAPVELAAAATATARDPDAPIAPIPGARLGADGVWDVPRLPGKDERAWFMGMNAKWRVVENPESVRLFLGEDGRFGFDDFLDIVNPLQHIPFVNLAYRALTGDQISGAAQMVGAVAMGPLAAVSTVTDLAFKSETGQGLAANGIAMVFGGEDAPADASYATAAGAQMADLSQLRRGSNR